MPQFDLIFVRLTSLPIVALIFYVFHVYIEKVRRSVMEP